MKIDLKPNELVVKAGDSQFINGKIVKGKLIVTNQRLYFEAMAQEDKLYNQEILPSDIREVLPFSTFAFLSNGLNIITKGGEELKFKVKKRKSWELLINKMY
ncbi:MAG: hypothetical protein MI975_29030 [Cytophagales bacterium]|nr:hypothetical protein [Cytophagales bacterium]